MRTVAMMVCVGVALTTGCAADELNDGVEELDSAPYDDEPEREVHTTSQPLITNAVGVLRGYLSACPGEERNYTIRNETSNNRSSKSGWTGDSYVTSNPTNLTVLRFCEVSPAGFKQVRSSDPAHNYAVLKLGASCPPGSVQFSRYFDGEDDNGASHPTVTDAWGNITESQGNIKFTFCMFRASSSASTSFSWPSIGAPYGVLGGASLQGAINSGWLYSDDEDDANRNSVSGSTDGISTFMDVGANTRLRMARVR